MSSTFTSGKGTLEKQTTGENENSWGTQLNLLIDALDRVTTGVFSSSGNTGGTVTPDATDDAQNFVHQISGTLVSNLTYVLPAAAGLYLIYNNTEGSFSVTVKVSGQTGVTVPQGGKKLVYCNGTDIVEALTAADDFNVTGDLTVDGELIMSADQIRDEDFADVASAATTNLGAVASNRVRITGTTTITSFGSTASGFKFVRFAAALTLTHNATSLILPGAANITTAANDCCIALPLGSGNWIVVDYQRASGAPIALGINGQTAETAPATGDSVAIYDASATAERKMTLENLLKVLNSLTEDTAPDNASDFLLAYDTSASAVKKVKPQNIVGDYFIAHKNGTNQGSVSSGVETKITFGTEAADTASAYDTTNSRFVPPNGEVWLLEVCFWTTDGSDGMFTGAIIYKNGGASVYGAPHAAGNATPGGGYAAAIVVGNGTDYYEGYITLSNSGSSRTLNGAASVTYFRGHRIG
jgi:hypothetical protein